MKLFLSKRATAFSFFNVFIIFVDMKYFVIAGEASGDIHAAQLIKALRAQDAKAEFKFFGGDFMQDACGNAPVVHYKDMAYMGIIEVVKHLGTIMGFLKTARKIVDDWRPDAVVLVDYPSFNLKVAKYAYSKNIPAFYYISPKVWAWKEYRVKDIKKYVKQMYSILPFEPAFFARHNYRVEYVGNPSVNEIDEARKQFHSVADFCNENAISTEKDIIAVLPGSRKQEIRDNLKEMLAAVANFPEYQPVVAGAPGLTRDFYDSVFASLGYGENMPKVIFGKSFELVHHAKAAVVTSGTATLETAIIGTPQVVCYRGGGSRLVYEIYSRVLKVKYVSLPNLIADAPVVKELLLHFCNAQNIATELGLLLDKNSEHRAKMLQGYDEIARLLTHANSAGTAAQGIINSLK